jgi:hypothetical protein
MAYMQADRKRIETDQRGASRANLKPDVERTFMCVDPKTKKKTLNEDQINRFVNRWNQDHADNPKLILLHIHKGQFAEFIERKLLQT